MLMTDYAFDKDVKKSGARKSGLSGSNSEYPGNPDTPVKFPESLGFQNTSEKHHSPKIFNLA
jgi:hypothetical protein